MKAVYVEWHDPSSHDPWIGISELDCRSNTIRTIGWLVKECGEFISLALNVDYDYEDDDYGVSCVMIIPKRLIKLQREVMSYERENDVKNNLSIVDNPDNS